MGNRLRTKNCWLRITNFYMRKLLTTDSLPFTAFVPKPFRPCSEAFGSAFRKAFVRAPNVFGANPSQKGF